MIANGGVESGADVEHCLEATGCNAVMVAEAALESPDIFEHANEKLCGDGGGDGGNTVPSSIEWEMRHVELSEEYLAIATQHPPPYRPRCGARPSRAIPYSHDLMIFRDFGSRIKSLAPRIALDRFTLRRYHQSPPVQDALLLAVRAGWLVPRSEAAACEAWRRRNVR
eukprot:SAG11_NODE_353_length_10348_cov_6.938335_10_plen_168_part_00